MKKIISLTLSLLPQSLRIKVSKIIFKKKHGYKVDVKNPETFSEKLFVKIKCDKKYIGNYKVIDKMLVKSVGEKHSLLYPKTLWHGNEITRTILDDMQVPFVIKTTIGSGDVKIIRDDSDKYKWINFFNKQVKKSYFKQTGEYPYKGLKNLIFIEEFLDMNGKVPIDIKVHCFNKGEKVIVSAYFDRDTDLSATVYDESMSIIDMSWQNVNKQIKFPFPDKFNDIVRVSKGMSSPYDYARVDLYVFKGELYIGEMTFTHGSANSKITPYEKDLEFGKLWSYKGLEKYQKKS